ncbi:MAG: hypothetical protein CMH77_05170 [Nitrospinae bacterium]|nr:hypothetical protein [Nitrospinota bacterium]
MYQRKGLGKYLKRDEGGSKKWGAGEEMLFGFRLGTPQFGPWRSKLLEEAVPIRIFIRIQSKPHANRTNSPQKHRLTVIL